MACTQTRIDLKEVLRAEPLRIGMSTRALVDLEEEHRVFVAQGVKAYSALQLEREDELLKEGAGFPVVKRLLNLNEPDSDPYVEVILLSQNSPDLSLRAFNSIEHYKLGIKHGSFTSGKSVSPFVQAWEIDLFLSNETTDVQQTAASGGTAARLGSPPPQQANDREDEVRIAFDGDAVVFSPDSDQVYKEKGLEAFLGHEKQNATNPMSGGPFANFLKKLSILRTIYMDDETGVSRVRIAIVTARNAPAHARVIHTLRSWGTPADEAHFVGAKDKAPFLKAFGADIFFDDQEKHVLGAAGIVPAGHVPGPHNPDTPVIPAAKEGLR